MKVLVTGTRSYAGTQFAKRVNELNKGWEIDFLSVRDNAWEDTSFANYDAVYHVAAIVHKKETAKNKESYFKVNRDLTYQLALKAKNEGVKSFIFLSTMAVYGLNGKIGEDTVISKETPAKPTSYYGKSKLEAEELLETLQLSSFNVAILRIPMIYGPNCPGNYRSLSKLARKTPVFPKINNRRSMIFVDHLSDVIAFIIEENLSGNLLVKNPQDVSTLEMVEEVAKQYNHNVKNSAFAGSLIKTLGNKFTVTKKMFSSIFYKDTDCYIEGFNYKALSFKDSITLSEGNILESKILK